MYWFNKAFLNLLEINRRFLMMGFCTTGVALMACYKSSLEATMMEVMPVLTTIEWSAAYICHYERPKKLKKGGVAMTFVEFGFFNALFYLGGAIMAMPGALLAETKGPKLGMVIGVLGGALTMTAVVLIDPTLCKDSIYAIRIMQGVWQASYTTSVNICVVRWIPSKERATMSAVVYSSLLAGLIIPYMATYIITYQGGKGLQRYELLIVIYSLIGMIWAALFFLSTASLPELDTLMSDEESDMLRHYIGSERPPPWYKKDYPWKEMMTSIPVWIGILVNIGSEMIMIINIHYVSKYLDSVIKLSTRVKSIVMMTNGLVTACVGLTSGLLADKLINKFKFKKDIVRKLYAVAGVWIPVAGIVLSPEVSIMDCNRTTIVTFFGICLSFLGLTFSSQKIIMMDLSPRYGGMATGIVTTFQGIAGVCFNSAAGYAITSSIYHRWMFMFFVVSFLPILSTYIFVIWGTTSLQHWNEPVVIKRERESSTM